MKNSIIILLSVVCIWSCKKQEINTTHITIQNKSLFDTKAGMLYLDTGGIIRDSIPVTNLNIGETTKITTDMRRNLLSNSKYKYAEGIYTLKVTLTNNLNLTKDFGYFDGRYVMPEGDFFELEIRDTTIVQK